MEGINEKTSLMRGVIHSATGNIELLYADTKGVIHKHTFSVDIVDQSINLTQKNTQTFQTGGADIQFLSVIPADFTPGNYNI